MTEEPVDNNGRGAMVEVAIPADEREQELSLYRTYRELGGKRIEEYEVDERPPGGPSRT
jgi:hypothetical protein